MKKGIVLSLVAASMLLFNACGDDAKKGAEAAKEATTSVVDKAKEAAAKTTEAVKETASKAAEATKETANKAVEATKEAAAATADKAKEAATKTTEAVKETASKAAEATKEAAAATANKAKEAVAGGADNAKGKAIFAKCAGCHGANAEKSALGKSEVIKGWDAAKVEEAINGYKAGTRNVHGMGGLMKGQVAALSDEDVKAVAAYISSLK